MRCPSRLNRAATKSLGYDYINKMPASSRASVSPKASPFLGMNLYTPAVMAAVAYIILALVIILPFDYPVYDAATDSEIVLKYDFTQRLIILLLSAIPIALSVYTINCMMGGKCVVWSYVVAIVTLIYITIFVITALMYTFQRQKAKEGFRAVLPTRYFNAKDK